MQEVAVHVLPALADPGSLAGTTVIVIDQLRASSTICAALAAGAMWVRPVLTVEDAREQAGLLSRGMPDPARSDPAQLTAAPLPSAARPLLGGERGGVRIEGFDLANSPAEYTREAVAGRGIVFTTTNGTAAMLHAAKADRIIVGCLANLRAASRAAARDPRPVHILCAGTHGLVSLEDVLAAGAFVQILLDEGRRVGEDDSALIALEAWRRAHAAGPVGVIGALRTSLGGRNLLALGLEADLQWCAQVGVLEVVPVFEPAAGLIRAEPAR